MSLLRWLCCHVLRLHLNAVRIERLNLDESVYRCPSCGRTFIVDLSPV